jgi:hypothetical protein
MNFQRLLLVAAAVLMGALVVTAMAGNQTAPVTSDESAVVHDESNDNLLAITPILPDRPTPRGSGKNIHRSVEPKSRVKEIRDFHRALLPMQDAARRNDVRSIRRSVNTLLRRSDALNRCQMPPKVSSRAFIKARRELQNSVKTLSRSCQHQSDRKVISNLSAVQQRYQSLEKLAK